MFPRFHPFIRLVLCAFAVLVAQMAAAGVLVDAGQLAPVLVGQPLPARTTLLLSFVAALITLLVVTLCRRWLDGLSLASLGLRARRSVPDFILGTLCGAFAVAFLFGALWLGGHLEIEGLSQRAREVGSQGIAARLAVWAAAMLCVALGEELLFRGYALHNLGVWLGIDRVGLGAAAILQGIVFALVHVSNFGLHPTPDQVTSAWQAMPNVALIGIFFALCYYKTGALWFPIGFHAAWNFFLGCVFSLPVSGLQIFRLFDVKVSSAHWLTGGPFGAEGSILLTIITATMIYVVRQSSDHPQALDDIEALVPRDETEIEIAEGSRAPRLRERKARRYEQTTVKPTFEGWNDMEPQRRAPYAVYKPPIPEPGQPAPAAAVSDAVSEAVPVEAVPVAEAAETFTEFRPAEAPPAAPPPTPPPIPPPSAPPVTPVAPPTPAASTPMPTPSAPATPAVQTPPVASPPASPAPETPPPPKAPPVKKPPAPRW